MKQNYDDNTILGEIIPIVTDDEVTAYCVNFQKDNKPNGYVVIDSEKYATNYVKEFSLSGLGIYDALVKNSGTENVTDTNKVIYSLGNYDYAISINSVGTWFYSSMSQLFTKAKLQAFWDKLSDFVSDILDTRTESEKWVEVGHAIVAVGYREYTNGDNYLRVYDGWNDTADKYIWFNSDYFTSIKGTKIEVSK